MYPPFISFYTGNDYYKEKSETLVNKCKNLGIPFFCEKIEDLGAYWKNTLQKPSFILRKIKEFKSDIVWIDIDTNIIVYDDSMKKWESDILFSSHTGTLEGIKASPLCLKYTDRTIKFLEVWADISDKKIRNSEIDFDHDVMKFEVIPMFSNRIGISLMKGNNEYKDYSDGKIIVNGNSRVRGKGEQTTIVMNRNKSRNFPFSSMSLNDFKIHHG